MKESVRPAVESDVDGIIRVCNHAWDGIWQGECQMFLDRIRTFPECGIVVGEIDGVIEGYVSVQLADNDTIFRPTWNEGTDFGCFVKTHTPQGVWLHGAGLAVTPKGSRANLTGDLVRFLYEYAASQNKLGGRFITRIPGYYRFCETMTPEDYVSTLRNGKPIDPELRVMARHGFHVVQPAVVFRDYVEGGGDPKSCGCSVLIDLLVK